MALMHGLLSRRNGSVPAFAMQTSAAIPANCEGKGRVKERNSLDRIHPTSYIGAVGANFRRITRGRDVRQSADGNMEQASLNVGSSRLVGDEHAGSRDSPVWHRLSMI